MTVGIANPIPRALPAFSDWYHRLAANGLKAALSCRCHAQIAPKPDWVHVPDRVWKRNSALILSLHGDGPDE